MVESGFLAIPASHELQHRPQPNYPRLGLPTAITAFMPAARPWSGRLSATRVALVYTDLVLLVVLAIHATRLRASRPPGLAPLLALLIDLLQPQLERRGQGMHGAAVLILVVAAPVYYLAAPPYAYVVLGWTRLAPVETALGLMSPVPVAAMAGLTGWRRLTARSTACRGPHRLRRAERSCLHR